MLSPLYSLPLLLLSLPPPTLSATLHPPPPNPGPGTLYTVTPALAITYTPLATNEDWPSIVHWPTMLQSFIDSESQDPTPVTKNFISFSEPGVGYDPGAYIALVSLDDPKQAFTGEVLLAVLEKLKSVERPVRANLTIATAGAKGVEGSVVGVGCISGESVPCELDVGVASAR